VIWTSSISRRIFLFLTGGLLTRFLQAETDAAASLTDTAKTIPRDRFQAYLTSQSVGSARIPITAERIVVVLGKDERGHALEISIDLTRPASDPLSLSVYAIREPLQNTEAWTHWPRLLVTRVPAVNVAQLRVAFEETPPSNSRELEGMTSQSVVLRVSPNLLRLG